MEIRLDQILFQVLNFAIILYVLRRFVFGPVMKMLDDRASKIKDGLHAAEKNLKIQEELEAKAATASKDAQKEAKSVITEAKKQAEELIKQAEVEAKEKARKTLAKEREAFEASLTKEKAAFQKQLRDIVSEATEMVLRGTVDVKVQQDLVDKQIKQISASQLQ